ncbi:hypothetical protein [Legionella impletisoli]|uniref:Uncharacterized protein n=1 Tax=Legionella impletisoli TaxID=343510 RepID=A0A917NC96_9GAMM|nr:hypothetical protein [Legionella impletisoli]GGI86553.1 hypothetical protein GCM10007966_14000 [Legionella impletisoli]
MKDQHLFNSYKRVLELKNSVHKNYISISQFVESHKKIRKFVLNSNLIPSIGDHIDDTPEPKKGQQELRTEIIEGAFQKITDIARKQGIIIHRDRMPGTKSEFIDLMVTIEPRILYIAKSTTNDYFKRMKIKFKPGVKSGYCTVMRNLKVIVN